MLSPKLAASVGGIAKPLDIHSLPLLDPQHDWWSIWLRANGLPENVLKRQAPAALHTQALDADAAIKGLGVALLTPSYDRAELAEGRSILEDRWSYWLAYSEGRRNTPRIKVFRDRLVSQSGRGNELPWQLWVPTSVLSHLQASLFTLTRHLGLTVR